MEETLLGYFTGQVPPKAIICSWDREPWGAFGWQYVQTKTLTKGFFLFPFANKSHVPNEMSQGPWIYKNTLLVPRFEDFSANQYVQCLFPIWVQFNVLPMQMWSSKFLNILPFLTSLLFHAFLCLNEGLNHYNERRHSLVPVLKLTLLLIEPPHVYFYVIYVIHIQRKYGVNLKTQILHSLNHANF